MNEKIDKDIESLKAQLRRIKADIVKESADLEKKSQKYDLLSVLTPAEEREADRLYNRIDRLEVWLDAVEAALLAL